MWRVGGGLTRGLTLGALAAATLAGGCGVSHGLGADVAAEADVVQSDGCSPLVSCSGVCVDILSDPNNCGACGARCLVPIGPATCVNGSCVSDACGCGPGFLNCNGTCVDGCELDGRYDPANCGACGNMCRAGQICIDGLCLCECPASRVTCGDVCCVDLSSDPNNCGACGNVCPPWALCAGGFCACACSPGLTCCALACLDLSSDPNNCGACGRACMMGQACVGGVCWTPG